jgi:polysaccharide export outer membrane protein
MTRIIMTRIILGAIALAFGAAMSAQGQGVPPPTFDSQKNAPPVSQKQVGTTKEAPPRTNPRAAQPDSFAASAENAYRIGVFDVLDISVFQVPELTKSVQVADSGTINLPLVGEVRVAGRTAQEVERDLTAKLGAEYLQNPQVTVFVKEYNSQNVTISGAIKKPGVYPIRGKATLAQLVALAGDFDAGSDSTVLILREQGGKRMAGKYDVSAIRQGQAQDPTLQGGDQIVAGTSAIKKGFNTILKSLPLLGTMALL